jgi:subtilisin family serine protease
MTAPGATVWPLRVLDASGQGHSWAVADAMLHAVDPDGNPATNDGAQVINLSLGTTTRTEWMRFIKNLVTCSAPDVPAREDDMSDPGYNGDKARCANAPAPLVVAGAGNGASTLPFYPAAEDVYSLVSVAATTSAGTLATFSNYGKWIAVAAPGEQITSTMPGGLYGTWSGTSMAAPLVAGTAALVRSLAPRMPAKDIVRCLEETASRVSGSSIRQVNPSAILKAVAKDPRSCR